MVYVYLFTINGRHRNLQSAPITWCKYPVNPRNDLRSPLFNADSSKSLARPLSSRLALRRGERRPHLTVRKQVTCRRDSRSDSGARPGPHRSHPTPRDTLGSDPLSGVQLFPGPGTLCPVPTLRWLHGTRRLLPPDSLRPGRKVPLTRPDRP